MDGMVLTTLLNAAVVSTSALVGSTVVTVAARGLPSRSDISPKNEPGPSTAISVPSWVTAALPSMITTNSRPISPCRARVLPSAAFGDTAGAGHGGRRASRIGYMALDDGERDLRNDGTPPITAHVTLLSCVRRAVSAGVHDHDGTLSMLGDLLTDRSEVKSGESAVSA